MGDDYTIYIGCEDWQDEASNLSAPQAAKCLREWAGVGFTMGLWPATYCWIHKNGSLIHSFDPIDLAEVDGFIEHELGDRDD